MTLKTATNLVTVSLFIGLIIGFLQWLIYTISYFKYAESLWGGILSSGTGLVLLLIHTVPLIIFFSVLKSKQ
jgi:hypothetical protein